MFKTRLISGIILVAAALAVFILGGWVLFFVTLALSLIAAFEVFRALGLHPTLAQPHPLAIGAYVGIGLFYASLVIFRNTKYAFAQGNLQLAMLVLTLMLLLFIYVFGYPRFHTQEVALALFGIVYAGVMLSYLFQIRELSGGQFRVWLVFLSSWGCDTGAYCTGMLIGRHKMAPNLSPKKSIEGALGGVATSIVLALIFALITREPVLSYMLIAGIGAVISMIGDLAASAIKRNTGIKDFGHLIPGHGGVLDRFDSVIFTAPAIYFLSLILI